MRYNRKHSSINQNLTNVKPSKVTEKAKKKIEKDSLANSEEQFEEKIAIWV